jgi:hypothetical protein
VKSENTEKPLHVSQSRSYTLTCDTVGCGYIGAFTPTAGQLQALKGGGWIKIKCPKCRAKLYWTDPGLKELKAKENQINNQIG